MRRKLESIMQIIKSASLPLRLILLTEARRASAKNHATQNQMNAKRNTRRGRWPGSRSLRCKQG